MLVVELIASTKLDRSTILIMPDTTSETHLDTSSSFEKRRIIDYLESRHLSDGGYFFAQVEPSSGLDTYLAVQTLSILGVKIKYAKSITSFWEKQDADDLFEIFLAVETYKVLGSPATVLDKYRQHILDMFRDGSTLNRLFYISPRGAIRLNSLSLAIAYVTTVGKELHDLLYLVTLSRELKIKLDNKKIVDFVKSLQNKDGGFGHRRHSHLMTTYHALCILKILAHGITATHKTYDYLIRQWKGSKYLEDLFYATESISLLGRPLPSVKQIIQFVDSCQRNNGGFSRAMVTGIPTIEDTYYAVKLIKMCEQSSHQVFFK
jgi:hypothetical protein